MKLQRLENNIKDAIIEQQLKLGYVKETVGLYYPAESLKNILGCKEVEIEDLDKTLHEFSEYVKERLGNLEISHNKNRYCIKVPPRGSEYIHMNAGDVSFLKKLIESVQQHDCNKDKILKVFKQFGSEVIIETMKEEDFDFMVRFADHKIDEYYYCFKDEGYHLIYHRFTKEDYEELIG